MSKVPFVVLITDTCKECSATQINMNALTFEKYLAVSTGLIGITFRQVSVITSKADVQSVSLASQSCVSISCLPCEEILACVLLKKLRRSPHDVEGAWCMQQACCEPTTC